VAEARSAEAAVGLARRDGPNAAGQGTNVDVVAHYLVATDADWILEQLQAALGGPDTTWTVCRSGKDVRGAVAAAATPIDAALLDLQIGTMGGMAVTLDLRLEESGRRLPHVRVVMLLDRSADVFLALRSAADGWLIKPLDAIRLRRALRTVVAGGTYTEGVPGDQPVAAG
jgi:DNA-binding response OmpR family regulator